MNIEKLKSAIRDVPDFPQEGIVFKDITPILNDTELFKLSIDVFVERYKDQKIDKVAVVDARGFLFGSALAYLIGAGVIPVRKKGKLPYETIEASYELEYGTATLAMHVDGISKGERVLIVDDLLATGGTARATAQLIEQVGGDIVEIAFLIELAFLNGREKLDGYNIFAPLVF